MYKIVDTNTKDIFLGSETAVIRYAQDLLDDQDSDWKDDHFWELKNIDVKTFKGAERRFKETFVGNNVIIDDYAHHPTEVKVTIKGARQKYPDKKIIAVFKAHTFSRVEEFSDEFAAALNLADKAFVMDINYDRENPEDYPGIDAYAIINKLENGDYIEQGMSDKLLEFDNAVILFMSSKEIYLLEEEYIKKLEEREKETSC